MQRNHRQFALAAALCTGLALAGCGGNHHHDDDVTDRVPDSASESVTGFIDYLMKLVVSSADGLEPVDVGNVTAPTDDTGEPVPMP